MSKKPKGKNFAAQIISQISKREKKKGILIQTDPFLRIITGFGNTTFFILTKLVPVQKTGTIGNNHINNLATVQSTIHNQPHRDAGRDHCTNAKRRKVIKSRNNQTDMHIARYNPQEWWIFYLEKEDIDSTKQQNLAALWQITTSDRPINNRGTHASIELDLLNPVTRINLHKYKVTRTPIFWQKHFLHLGLHKYLPILSGWLVGNG